MDLTQKPFKDLFLDRKLNVKLENQMEEKSQLKTNYRKPMAKMTPERFNQAVELKKQGYSNVEIAKEIGFSYSGIMHNWAAKINKKALAQDSSVKAGKALKKLQNFKEEVDYKAKYEVLLDLLKHGIKL